jgi:rRNA maturation protein Rpf1
MFTTSRYASGKTRELARRLAEESGEPFVSRGKRTIAGLAELARKSGEERICVIEEQDGRPSVLVTIEVDERGGWRWAGERPVEDVS